MAITLPSIRFPPFHPSTVSRFSQRAHLPTYLPTPFSDGLDGMNHRLPLKASINQDTPLRRYEMDYTLCPRPAVDVIYTESDGRPLLHLTRIISLSRTDERL